MKFGNKVKAKNKIFIMGDRNEPIISALTDIRFDRPDLFDELSKVIDYEVWDGYPLKIHEEIDL